MNVPAPRVLIVSVGDGQRESAVRAANVLSGSLVSVPDLAAAPAAVAAADCDTVLIVADASNAVAAFVNLLQAVAATARDIALGFLYGRGEPQLLAAAERLEPRGVPPSGSELQPICVHADFASYVVGAQLRRVTAGSVPISRSSGDGAHAEAILYLIGHANGHHAVFDTVALCRREVASLSPDDGRALPCYHGAECALRFDALDPMPLDNIDAAVVVAIVCWGVSLGQPLFSESLSLGDGMLRFGKVRTVVTLVRASLLPLCDFLFIYYRCSAGDELGRVANAVNHYRTRRGEACDVICLGDPTYRLHKTVTDATATLNGGSYSVAVPAAAVPRDLRVPIGGHTAGSPVLLITAGEVSAGLVTDTDVFVTVPPSKGNEIVGFQIVDLRSVTSALQSYAAVQADVGAMKDFAVLVGRKMHAAAPLAAEAMVTSLTNWLSVLEHEIKKRGSAALPAGGMIRASDIVESNAVIGQLIGCAANAWLDVAEEVMGDGAMKLMRILDAYGRYIDDGSAGSCGYCGQPCLAFRRVGYGPAPLQQRLACDRCGLVYDGESNTSRWLAGDPILVPGTACVTSINVTNAYECDLEARAVLRIGQFSQGSDIISRSAAVPVGAGTTVRVSCEFTLPESCRAGVYFMNAAIVLGLKPAILRKPVVVAPPVG